MVEITEEEIENGIKIRDKYHQQMADFKKYIAYNQEIISRLSRENRDLELRMCLARPKLQGAERLCEKCDIVSMKYSHIVFNKDKDEKEYWYKCIACGYEDHTALFLT